ncbi:hypothetical protein DOY98_12985 [Escherichia coli]|nr:hypothetical protein [Escherichia coli]
MFAWSVRSARLYIPLLFLFILIDSVSFFKLQRPYRYSPVIINKRIKNETDNTSSTGGGRIITGRSSAGRLRPEQQR